MASQTPKIIKSKKGDVRPSLIPLTFTRRFVKLLSKLHLSVQKQGRFWLSLIEILGKVESITLHIEANLNIH
jgi:hypothetical protein